MNFWRKDIEAQPTDTRADVIIRKKRRKQDPQASGLAAVAIQRTSARAVHQRNEDRHVLEGSMAKAVIAGREHEVQLLNLSSNGVMIAYDGELEIGQTVRIAVEECAPITTAVRWLRRGRVGLEFIAETVIIAEAGVQDFIIKTIAREQEKTAYNPTVRVGAEQRGVETRHQLVWVGKLRSEMGEATARLRNISSAGAMIALSGPTDLKSGAKVVLGLQNTGALASTIRWVADRQIGLEFHEEFDVSKLVEEACAELAPPDDAGGLGAARDEEDVVDDDFDSLRIRLGNVKNPHRPPEMEYGKLTLDEVYATLYPEEAAKSAKPAKPQDGKSSVA